MKTVVLVLAVFLLSACGSKSPEAISRIPAEELSLTQVRLDVDAHVGSEVRWGGRVSRVENKSDGTWIEIVRYPLAANGKPLRDRSDGRFIASFDRFMDPAVYDEGRRLTVVGKIEGKVKRPIGEFEYLFPIVAAEGSYLWKPSSQRPYSGYPPPWWYYDPWFYHPWPYHRHPHWH